MIGRILIFLVLGLFADDGADEGRRGNALYRQGAYAEAAQAYRTGLDGRDGAADAITSALWNNLGMALYRAEDLSGARGAFERALATAPSTSDSVRALYNAGNAAFAQDSLDAALDRYRRALLNDPSHENARYNYEYVKRQQTKASSPRSRRSSIEPSAFARQLKQRADSLVAERQYEAAHRLMRGGLQRDSTVAAYRSFIQRTGEVAQIDTMTTQR